MTGVPGAISDFPKSAPLWGPVGRTEPFLDRHKSLKTRDFGVTYDNPGGCWGVVGCSFGDKGSTCKAMGAPHSTNQALLVVLLWPHSHAPPQDCRQRAKGTLTACPEDGQPGEGECLCSGAPHHGTRSPQGALPQP